MSSNIQNGLLTLDIETNEQIFGDIFQNCSDIVFRPIQINGQKQMLIIYIDGFIDVKLLDQVILKPMIFEGMPQGLGKVERIGQIIEEHLVAVAQTKVLLSISDVVQSVLKGNIVILSDKESSALTANMKSLETRNIEEPSTESVIRGPKEGFTETLRTNMNMLRRRIKSPRFKMESIEIGVISQTDVVIAYIEGIANDSVLEEVRKRVKRIQIDGVLDSGYIEEFIEDVPFSPFPQIQNTERPDVVAANLLEGKIAIIVDGTPHVLLVPFTFWAGLQAADDYYIRFIFATAVRWIRFILLNISLLFTSFYVAATTFHPETLPTNLLLSFASAREPSPFPELVEALLMEFLFEGLREAGLRLPKTIGSAVSIVGSLVIGQAAVEAGIVSTPMVIVVATSGIASFAIPRYNLGLAYRLLRFPMLILAGTFGFYGISIGLLTILIHLVSLRSFGVPYLSPLAPQIIGNLKDGFFLRVPRWLMTSLQETITGKHIQRILKGQKPSPKQ
ncbi:spore germination protein [Paenibacillus elgii]|nr:spore germination protein [Paenibacillus elgii]